MLLARFGEGNAGLTIAVAQLSYIAELLGDYPNAVLMDDFNCTVG